MIPDSRQHQAQRARILRLMVLRLVVVTVLFAGVTVLLFSLEGNYQRILPIYSVAIATYGFSSFYAMALKRVGNLDHFAYLQFVMDSLCITVAGWLVSPISGIIPQLFVLHILAVGVTQATRGALLFASLDALLYLGLVIPEMVSGNPGESPLASVDGVLALTRGITTVLAFFLSAFVSGTLATRLRASEAALVSAGVSLEQLREIHGNIVDNITSGILTCDRSGLVTSFNGAAETITGWQAPEVVGRAGSSLFPESGEHLTGVAVGESGGETPPATWEGRHRRPDDTVLHLRFQVSDLRNADGQQTGKILIFDDMTRVREMEARLEKDERMAVLGRLAAGIVHEVRNPLASISGSIQLLRSELRLKEEDAHLMDIVVREADRLNSLVSNFLGIARPQEARTKPIRVDQVAREVIRLVRQQGYANPGVEVVEEFDSVAEVRADPDQLRQVLWNLVSNALRHSSGGQGAVRVVLQNGASDGRVELHVIDDGPGIPETVREQIFEPFFTTHTKGTGLGLFIARELCATNGASLELAPAASGAHFIVAGRNDTCQLPEPNGARAAN